MGKRRGEMIKDKFNAVGSKTGEKKKNKCRALHSWLQFFCTRLLWFDEEAGIGWTEQRID